MAKLQQYAFQKPLKKSKYIFLCHSESFNCSVCSESVLAAFLQDTFPGTKTPRVWYVVPKPVQTTSAAHKNVRSLHINQSQDCWSDKRFFYVRLLSFFLRYGKKRQHKPSFPHFSLSSLSLEWELGVSFVPHPSSDTLWGLFFKACVLDPSQSG